MSDYLPDDDDIFDLIVWERDCPYFARHHEWKGHDPDATCAFGCTDEPLCVTGSWLGDEEREALRIRFEAEHNGS